MNQAEQKSPRMGLFRRVAVLRYRSQIEMDAPLLLERRRPVLPWLAMALILAVGIAWAGN